MKEFNKKNLIIVISSPSGAGKTTVCNKIVERDQKIGLSISDTTRPARDNEINGVDYNFINELEFKLKIKNNAYLEHAYVFGNYYGSPSKNVEDHFINNRDIIFDIDWQGASQLRKIEFSNIVSIFIVPPSRDIIYQRLKLRSEKSGDDLEAIDERMKQYDTEMHHKDEYDYIIINDEIEKCVKDIELIINNHRNRLIN